MSENFKPAYYSIMPASVRYDKSLHPNAKILYSEITALCQKEGYCWASNSHFATLYDVAERSVINWLNNLKEKGYIKTKFFYKKDSREIDHRRIYILDPIITKNLEIIDGNGGEENFTTRGENGDENNFTPPSENSFNDGGEENFTYNNKSLLFNNYSFPKDLKNAKKEEVKKFYDFKNMKSDFEKFWLTNERQAWHKVGNRFAQLEGWEKDFKERNPAAYVENQKPKKPIDKKYEKEKQEMLAKIKFILGNNGHPSASIYFNDLEIDSDKVIVTDKRAMKYEQILADNNIKIELK